MIILGIHDGHTATACIMRDGKIVAAISEERLNRKKGWGGIPKESIKNVMKIANVGPDSIDSIAVASLINPITSMTFSKKSPSRMLFGLGAKFLPRSFLRSDKWVDISISITKKFRRKEEIIKVLRELGFKNPKPNFYEHHKAHAATAYYFNHAKTKGKNLVITCDGSGDGICATVNIGEGGEIKRIERISNYNSLGELYTRVTQYLGMKPLSHEYKVMGLAAYCKEAYIKDTYNVFSKMISINPNNPLRFQNVSGAWKDGYIKKFDKLLRGKRFDNIAGGLQRTLENVIIRWIKNAIKKTGVHDIALAGGVFMNVKANMLLSELDEVDSIFIFPSCGDDSLCIGAAALEYTKLRKENGEKVNIKPLGPIYFGLGYNEDYIENYVKKLKGFKVEYTKDIDKYVGEHLSKGKIIARFSGNMEFGARALGNRSILADARNIRVINRINDAIKMRDFWMPFAPAILEEREAKYIVNKKGIFAPYMIMAFKTTEKGRIEIAAGTHQKDFTARPQIVRKEWNLGYHKVLRSFEKQSGVGGLLNTSFNIHGDPIVCSPEDAIDTFKRSGLDALALENWLITKK